MALFKNSEDSLQKTPIKSTHKAPTFISKEMEVTGDFNGQGAVQVEGILNGDINVNSVVISESGVVNGNIKAQSVIINGKLKGGIKCNTLEIMKSGSVSDYIEVKNLKVTGEAEGKIIVSNLVDMASTGSIHGKITLGKLIIDEGGKIIGSIEEYKEKKPKDNKVEKKIAITHEIKEVKKPHPKGKKS